MDWVLRKFAYLYLKVVELLVNSIVFAYSVVHCKKSKNVQVKKIAAYWYTPIDLTGSNIRLGGWKKFFENDGFQYDNFYINTLAECTAADNGSWTHRYLFFAKCLWRRLPQILNAHNYDVIWISRSIIPDYPRKTAYIEKRLRNVVCRLIIDTTDGGDYSANPKLMEDTLKQADEITIGFKFQMEMYGDRFKVNQIYWTIPTDNYIIKQEHKIKDIPIIGWMGSPTNFEQVRRLLPVLKKVRETHEFVFRYICRKNLDTELEGLNVEHHFYGDDYYDLIASFDIGISPYLDVNIRTKGKIAMKHQEFLMCGIPQVCSNVAISEFVETGRDVLIATTEQEWESCITSLLDNESQRIKLAENGKHIFNEYYLFESQYEKLKSTLTRIC